MTEREILRRSRTKHYDYCTDCKDFKCDVVEGRCEYHAAAKYVADARKTLYFDKVDFDAGLSKV